MPRDLRQLLGRPLGREPALALMDAGGLGPSECSVVWCVKGRGVVQPVTQMAVPTREVAPVRRVGSFLGAGSRIAMYPVEVDGYCMMLTVESKLELRHAQQLVMRPGLSNLRGQPCVLVWRRGGHSLWHIPDFAAVVDGHLVVFDVKPARRLTDRFTRAVLRLTAESLRVGRVGYEVLSDMSAQRAINLAKVDRCRRLDPDLAGLRGLVADRRPATIGGAFLIIGAVLDTDTDTGTSTGTVQSPVGSSSGEASGLAPERMVPGLGVSLEAMRAADEVVKNLLAHGMCATDLDQPLTLASRLSWSPGRRPAAGPEAAVWGGVGAA